MPPLFTYLCLSSKRRVVTERGCGGDLLAEEGLGGLERVVVEPAPNGGAALPLHSNLSCLVNSNNLEESGKGEGWAGSWQGGQDRKSSPYQHPHSTD